MMCCAVLCGRVLAGDSDDDDCVQDGTRYDDPSHPESEAYVGEGHYGRWGTIVGEGHE